MGPGASPHGDPNGSSPRSGNELAIRVVQEGSTLHLRFAGALDWACVGRIETALERISELQVRRVVFDLEQLEFMDSAGLTSILKANERARSELVELVVVRPRGLANRVFTLTRASKALTLVDSS